MYSIAHESRYSLIDVTVRVPVPVRVIFFLPNLADTKNSRNIIITSH